MKKLFYVLSVSLLALAVSCSKDDGNGGQSKEGEDKYQDIEVVDGKVLFYVETADTTVHSAMKQAPRGTKVYVNNKEYQIEKDENGRSFVQVAADSKNSYVAAYFNNSSKKHYSTAPFSNLKVPYSQFRQTTAQAFRDFPMYAAYSKETGNKLVFKDAIALVDIYLNGSDAAIASVKLSSPDDVRLAGVASIVMTKLKLNITKGLPFVVMNCTQNGTGTSLSSSGIHFYLPVIPGNYPNGLDVTLCDMSHGMMAFHLDIKSLSPNEVVSVSRKYEPDPDILFYEGFDNCVWGGNYAGGEGTVAFAPSGEKFTYEGGKDLTGLEESFTEIGYDYPATGFIQSNDWSQCSGKTVGTSHVMSESYLTSRNFIDYKYLFRCQEFQGCMGVGFSSNGRGILQTPANRTAKDICNGIFSADVCMGANFNGMLELEVINGGYPVEVTLDGTKLDLAKSDLFFSGVSATAYVRSNRISIPSSAASPKKWHHIEVKLERITGGTAFYITDNKTSTGTHSFLVDNITLKKTSEVERGDLRVLYWNIQNGMWADQQNNYDNFVKWVKRYDPDVCVWCECATIYKDNTGSGIGNSAPNYKGYLPGNYQALAARYGHQYTALGGARDNYPQEVTAKYPITTIRKITDGKVSGKPVSHGAAIQQITVKGHTINLVTLHTWPQGYRYGCPSSEQDASRSKNEGDLYREYEMQCIIDFTKNNSAYASHTDWLMMGDFNSRTRLDNWFYKYDDNSPLLLCHDVILKNTDYVDIIGKKYEGVFMSSTGGNSRIDFMYASPSMYSRVKNAMIIADDWADPVVSTVYSSFYTPSDHRPVLVDFTL